MVLALIVATSSLIAAVAVGLLGVALVAPRLRGLHLRRQRTVNARSLDELLALSPYEFEAATATLFRLLGYRDVELVGGAGDYAADVLATDPHGRRTVIQCKRYAPGNPVGSAVVQAFLGMVNVHHKAPRAILVTTSRFTPNCREIERNSGGVLELIDGQQLGKLLRTARQPRDGDRTDTPVASSRLS